MNIKEKNLKLPLSTLSKARLDYHQSHWARLTTADRYAAWQYRYRLYGREMAS